MRQGLSKKVVANVSGIVSFAALVFSQSAWVQAAPASYAKYVVLSGIRGEGSFPPGSIDILSISYGLSAVTSAHGAKASLGDISIMKKVDVATPQLMRDAVTGKLVTGDIYFQKVTGKLSVPYFHLRFVGTITDDQQSASSSDDSGAESFSIVPQQETLTVTEINPDGSAGHQEQFSWNAKTNTSSTRFNLTQQAGS